MRLFALSVRDSATASFGAPLFFASIGQAERWFRDECNAQQSDFFKHPEDYELHILGAYDTDSGELMPETPRLVMRGLDAQRKPS